MNLSAMTVLLLAAGACSSDTSNGGAGMPDQTATIARDAATPDLALPDLALPDLATPDLALPDLATPDLATPDLARPDLFRCASDGDCPMTTPRCDPTSGQCVACLATGDTCPRGTYCAVSSSGSQCATGCKTTADCPMPADPGGGIQCCAHACVDTSASTTSCGRCGNACASAQACCSGACTDEKTDVLNCGGCNAQCAPAGATGACSAGQCTIAKCSTGLADCNNTVADGCEIDTTSDVNNCGACGTVCPAQTVCHAGRCDDLRCAEELAAGSSVALPNHGWPRHRHDNRSSGWTPAVVADLPTLRWKKFIGGTTYDSQNGLASSPVVDDKGSVFVGAGSLDAGGGRLFAFDVAGNPLWTFAAMRTTGLSTPALRRDGTVFISSNADLLFAVTATGSKLWSYPVGADPDGHPLITKDGLILYPSDDGHVYALDSTGALVWKSDATAGPGEADAGLSESCDGRVLVGGVQGWTSLDARTGVRQWRVTATGSYQSNNGTPVVGGDGVMYGVDGGGTGWAIGPTGNVLWSRSVGPAGASAPLHVGARLYVVLDDGNLHALSAATGIEIWARPVGNRLTRGVGRIASAIADGRMRLYVGSDDGNLYAFDTDGNLKWKQATSGVAHAQLFSDSPAIGDDGSIYVPGNDGYLYVFR